MPISNEVRRLGVKWDGGTGWPKRLEWLEIEGIRGWRGERFECRFPIMAIVGENGVGKSTVLQAAAATCRPRGKKRGARIHHASWFFPDTAWESIENAAVRYQYREGNESKSGSIRKPTERWRGYEKRPEREMRYVDLGRIQPVSERPGYYKLAKSTVSEISADAFDSTKVDRISQIMGRNYEDAKMSLTDGDKKRTVPVLKANGLQYSGFHQGAGETAITELLEVDFPKYGLILIDEVESSLHPRAQRRLIRDLATMCKNREVQIILTTHSTFILDELPLEARACIMLTEGGREIVYGVTPDFAMSRMDDVPHYECDLYVEDPRSKRLLSEIIVAGEPDLLRRCQIVPFGAASVGRSLGHMVAKNRFPRPTRVFLDGDESPSEGCFLLPGEDAPERVVFEGLAEINWGDLAQRIGRGAAETIDACESAKLLGDHHAWLDHAANRLVLGGGTLWQAMCAEWATKCMSPNVAAEVVQIVGDVLSGLGMVAKSKHSLPTIPTNGNRTTDPGQHLPKEESANEPERPSSLSLFDAED